MSRKKRSFKDFAYHFSDEKLDEFKGMPVRQRLQWLEEANGFINRTIGFKKRAVFDVRFEGFLKK
ncbi:MAG: hypothetical protein ABFR82_07345 [Nitrospirota bacterium]